MITQSMAVHDFCGAAPLCALFSCASALFLGPGTPPQPFAGVPLDASEDHDEILARARRERAGGDARRLEARCEAAAPFYRPYPDGGDLAEARAKVLAVYAQLDTRVNTTLPPAQAPLDDAELRYELLTFGGVDHAFFNDTNARYDVAAAAEAYRRVLAWLERFLG